MSRFAWASDTHLDRIDTAEQIIQFAQNLVKTSPDGVFLSGDISISPRLVYHLSAIERIVQCPIYFVLGNHDYYNGEIGKVREEMNHISSSSQYLKYLPTNRYVSLTPKTVLIGHDGWYDGQYGDPKRSNVIMNDWVMIRDFVNDSGGYKYVKDTGSVKNKQSLLLAFQNLAYDSMLHVHAGIKSAASTCKNMIIMTHVPPFPTESNQDIHDKNLDPWYGSKVMGDMLIKASQSYPQHQFTILCGHSHKKQTRQITNNLVMKVGGSTYGSPSLSEIVNVE